MIFPSPRQRIYKLHYFDFIIDSIFGKFNSNRYVKKLENTLAKDLNVKNIKSLYRGRLGIYLAVKSIINEKKKEIIMSPYTIFDVVNMVICAGGKPVFVDITIENFSPDLKEISKLYNKNTAGIIITHMHKSVKNIFEIKTFCENKKIKLIEDAAIVFGASHKGQKLGTIADIGVFSFSMFKFVSSFNGGAIVTNDDDIFNKINIELKSFKKSTPKDLFPRFMYGLLVDISTNPIIFKTLVYWIFRYAFLNKINFLNKFTKNDPNPFKLSKIPQSYKLLISNHQAKSISKQLKDVEKNLIIRKKFFKMYYDGLKNFKQINIPFFDNNDPDAFINFPILYKERDGLLNYCYLHKRDLAIYFYRNCNELKFYKEYQSFNIINIKKINNELIILPTYPKYKELDVRLNIQCIINYFSKKN